MILSHKIALDPNLAQRKYCAQGAGTARFAWNWALHEWKAAYEAGEKVTEGGLRKKLNAIKRQEFPWMLDVTKVAPQHAIKCLGTAFQRFFAGTSSYPQPKKKGRKDSFRADNGPGTFNVNGRYLTLPVIGTIKMHEELRFIGKLLSVTISREAHRWFAAIAVDMPDTPQVGQNQAVCGVDLGISRLATVSDGTVVPAVGSLKRELKRLRRCSRALSRKVKGSSNRRKAKHKLARLHARIKHVRLDVLHKTTTDLTSRFGTIVLETLNVKGMMANGHLARAVADVGLYEFSRQVEYKAKIRSGRVLRADPWYPSSKLCSTSGCDYKNVSLTLSERFWTCPLCGHKHDRDLNAAINLASLSTASSAGIKACGAGSSARPGKPGRRSPATKQEPKVGINDHI
jgi:putative transposase